MKKKMLSLVLIAALALLTLCTKEPNDPVGQAPAIPPASTMKMDFSDFSSTALPKTATKNNWFWAATNVTFWNTAIVVTLAVPVSAFAESFNHNPELQSDGSWLWSYSFQVLGVSYTANLYGAIKPDGIYWDMFITQQGLYTDFHWFSGVSNLTVTEGTWDINLEPADPRPFLHIDWHRSNDDLSGDIKYTNVIPGSEQNGGYIYQAFNQPAPYTGMYDIYIAGSDNLVQIRWNKDTLAGRILDALHFGDDAWHCWDSELNDADCE